jgi:CRP-like cAMP-binding protein
MISTKASHLKQENHLLASLPREEYQRLVPHLEPVRFPVAKILYHTGDTVSYAYFPRGGMLSMLSTSEDGRTIEVGVIDREGVAGLPAVLGVRKAPYQIITQLPTSALRIRGDVLKEEFLRGGRLQDILLRYLHALVTQIAQSASCTRFHRPENRLCRWLLVSQDCEQSDTLHLTQEFLSYMLGVPRTSVTALAASLQLKGVIRYSRGKITILNRRHLEVCTCECYRFLRDEFRGVLAA